MDNSTIPRAGEADQGDTINWVALVVSLVALLGTMAQVLQQYIASAAGYTNCGESVMGKWHETKRRIFRPTELRFEVQFETPVIFVCPPNNKKGPIKNKEPCFVTGEQKSQQETRALLPEVETPAQSQQESHVRKADDETSSLLTLFRRLRSVEKESRERQQESRVHTADNERASWVTLLSQLQLMEMESREWQKQHHDESLERKKQEYMEKGPPRKDADENPQTQLPKVGFENHTLAVALQPKKRSWDTMPTDVKKPYATTAMCHLLEIAAMMGIYWKEFDRSKDRYRAEGNGYMLTGTHIPDLGLMFTFQICGKSKFKENRVIPVDEVKELCCGFVSTLFQEKNKDRRRLEFPNEEPKDLSFLQLGSMDEIAETMVLIDCNTDTANYFRSNDTKHGHLFPIPFELLGMLGKTLHIPNSGFRMLPNPTPYHWDKKFFDLRRLLREYLAKIRDSELELTSTDQLDQLREDAEKLVQELDQDKKNAEKLIQSRNQDNKNAGNPVQARNKDKESTSHGYSIHLLNSLHEVLDRCDEFLRRSNRDLVRMVIREHFQEVLRMINERPEGDGTVRDDLSAIQKAEHFSELTAASPERRQEVFMELYFYKVLRVVSERAVISYKRRRTGQYAPSMHSRKPSVESIPQAKAKAVSAPSQWAPKSTSLSPRHETSRPVPGVHIQSPGGASQDPLGMDAEAIWCTLVLRMLCWLLLHDFHKKDVQIPKSELLGSRLPVYIA